MNERRAVRIVEYAVAVTIVAILVSEILLYTPPGPSGVQASASIMDFGNSIRVDYSILTGVYGHFSIGIYDRNSTIPVSTIYYYFDNAYPSSWSTPLWWGTLPDHLATVAAARGYPLSIVILNANQLASFLLRTPNPGTLLILASGVLPDTVFTNSTNLVKPWILEGGDLVWMGARIGYWSGLPNQPLQGDAYVGNNGTNEFLPISDFGDGAATFAGRSTFSQFLNFSEETTPAGSGLSVAAVTSAGGTVIGNIEGKYTNAAIFPQGSGLLDYLSIPLLSDVTGLSISLLNLVETGVLVAPVTLLSTSAIGTVSDVRLTASINSNIPPLNLYPVSDSQVCFAAFQTDYLAPYGFNECVAASTVVQ